MDLAAIVGLIALGVAVNWRLLAGRTVAGLDSLTQFIPWYALLGERLRAGELPGWNPYTAAGAPFAADPLSGWTYLPAMVLFTVLPLAPAATAYLLLHPILAAVGAYLLARALDLPRSGALVAAVAYGQTGFLAYHNTCCFAFASVAAWLPYVLLGAELAIRADGWQARLRWWGLAGLALSQDFAAWIGQGTYYALLVFASFVLYRLLVLPLGASALRRPELRASFGVVAALTLHGGVPVGIGVGLAAAGLFPRIEYNALSSLAGGYPPGELQVGGWGVAAWWQLVWPTAWFAGALTVVLAVSAVWLARAWPWTPYFAALSICLLVLAGHGMTPIHRLADLLPGFARLHPHLPERILTVFYLGAALLAGAAAARIGARPARGPVVVGLLLLVVLADGRAAFEAVVALHGSIRNVDTLVTVDLDAYYGSTGAAQFLQARQADEEPFRFFGYAPIVDGLAYTQRFADADLVPLGVNNRAVTDGLHDVQGYNAIHLARYDAYLRALNGRDQNYHNADVFESGLRSPLLDALGARYLITPTVMPPGLADPRDLGLGLTTVYEDEQVRILERPTALPRAWIVHEARQVAPGPVGDVSERSLDAPARPSDVPERSLDALVTGAVNPRQVVLLEVPPPSLAQPLDPAAESATTARYTPDLVELDVRAGADGLLVVSEAYYPAWRAYVDGRPVPLYVANHALRAVPVPAGRHRVTLRYESATLRAGVAVSVVTAVLLLVAMAVPVRRRRRS